MIKDGDGFWFIPAFDFEKCCSYGRVERVIKRAKILIAPCWKIFNQSLNFIFQPDFVFIFLTRL